MYLALLAPACDEPAPLDDTAPVLDDSGDDTAEQAVCLDGGMLAVWAEYTDRMGDAGRLAASKATDTNALGFFVLPGVLASLAIDLPLSQACSRRQSYNAQEAYDVNWQVECSGVGTGWWVHATNAQEDWEDWNDWSVTGGNVELDWLEGASDATFTSTSTTLDPLGVDWSFTGSGTLIDPPAFSVTLPNLVAGHEVVLTPSEAMLDGAVVAILSGGSASSSGACAD